MSPRKSAPQAVLYVMVAAALAGSGRAQTEPARSPSAAGAAQEWNTQIMRSAAAASQPTSRQEYRIGPEDLIEVSVFEIPELSRVVRVSSAGLISLPLVGTLQAEGHSPMELEQVITESLRQNYVRDPQVSVFLKEYKSDPVSVVGAVKIPGLYQIQTRKSLIEVLAMAQGFSETKMLPGRNIVITRKTSFAEPADGASAPFSPAPVADKKSATGIVEVPIKGLLEEGDPKWNVPVYPGDVVRVVPAGTFYVAGDVNQPGGFPLTDFDNVSAIQAVAMAGGTKPTAKLKDAVIIRQDADGKRVEEKIDLKRVFEGKAGDPELGANDILLVPGSVGKKAAMRALEATIQVATGVAIWGL